MTKTPGAVRHIADTWNHHQPGEEELLRQALETGLTGASPMVERYEQALAKTYGTRHALAVSSGAAAVGVALAGLDFEPGDEVIVSPACPICTVLPIVQHGLRPVFADVRPDNFGLDPEAVTAAVTPRTRAVIDAPMWGYPVRADEIRTVTQAHGLPLVADLAHAHRVELNGRGLAAYGDVACFSTHEGKFLSTGEGGFVLTDDPARDARMRAYTRFGNLDGRTFGLNFKLSGLQAALGLARLGGLEHHTAVRRRNRDALLARLHNPHVRELPVVPGGAVSGYALLLQVVEGDGRKLVDHMVRHGVPSDVKKYDNRPLYEYPVLSEFRREYPNAAALLRSLTTVPLHPDLTDEDIDYIADTVNAYEP